MICPRCGNEWDASKSPCTRCGLVIRIPGQAGPLGRNTVPTQQNFSYQPGLPDGSGGLPIVRQQSSGPLGRPSSGNLPSNTPAFSRESTMTPNTPISTQAPNTSRPFNFSPTPDTPISAQTPNAQTPNTPRPFNFSPTPMPETPRPPASPSSASRSGVGHNNVPNRTTPQAQPNFGQPSRSAAMPTGAPHIDMLTSRSVPPRPHPSSQLGQSSGAMRPNVSRPLNVPRASRLVTDPLAGPGQVQPSAQRNISSPLQNPVKPLTADNQRLTPGTLLRGGRYRLVERQGSQEWLSGVSETMWIAQDAQRGASQVMMCEVVLPDSNSVVMQSTLRTATIALTSVGRHPLIPTLWDAFSDRGRSFFVFEPVDGESLLSRMRRTGRALQEQDIIECCLQMTEVLELLAQQSPPLVHGLISPEHIMITRFGSRYVLTNFSIVLAGGATQFISGIDRTRLSVYTAPEFVRGVIDVRSDLFSLLATAYHSITGSVPAGVSGSIPQAQRLNPYISAEFDAILAKGLRPVASQRYQRPSELRQDLLSMRSVTGTLVPGSGQGQHFEPSPSFTPQPVSRGGPSFEAPSQAVPDSVAQTFQSLAPTEDVEEQRQLLPAPENLPPMPQRNDTLHAALWLGAILVCLVLIAIVAHGFS